MVARFLNAGHQAAWLAGDEVYGGKHKLRDALEKRGTGYILAVACSHEVTTGAGKFRADTLAKMVAPGNGFPARCLDSDPSGTRECGSEHDYGIQDHDRRDTACTPPR
jgi:hypothetical protein